MAGSTKPQRCLVHGPIELCVAVVLLLRRQRKLRSSGSPTSRQLSNTTATKARLQFKCRGWGGARRSLIPKDQTPGCGASRLCPQSRTSKSPPETRQIHNTPKFCGTGRVAEIAKQQSRWVHGRRLMMELGRLYLSSGLEVDNLGKMLLSGSTISDSRLVRLFLFAGTKLPKFTVLQNWPYGGARHHRVFVAVMLCAVDQASPGFH